MYQCRRRLTLRKSAALFCTADDVPQKANDTIEVGLARLQFQTFEHLGGAIFCPVSIPIFVHSRRIQKTGPSLETRSSRTLEQILLTLHERKTFSCYNHVLAIARSGQSAGRFRTTLLPLTFWKKIDPQNSLSFSTLQRGSCHTSITHTRITQ